MAYPSKPVTYALEPKERLLKTVASEVSNAARGVTPADREYAEDYAWAIILSRFIGKFNISTWDVKPPRLVHTIWDFIASAQYMRMYSRDLAIREVGATGPGIIEGWEEAGQTMIRNIIDPDKEGDRMYLISTAGEIIYPRDDIGVPEVRSSGTRFFPDLDTDKSHSRTIDGSAEEIFKNIRRGSRTET